jgi:ubiquinone/menaquinone biosynthesis C-methylase UbiE
MSNSAPVRAEVWKQAAIVERFLNFHTAIPLAREQIGVMLALLATRQEPVGTFLDLGCGDGILAAALLEKYPESRGVLADFSEPMLEQARVQLKDHESQLQFVNVDYADPAWVEAVQTNGLLDTIVSRYSIHHQPDERKKTIYTEIFSILTPGGWFVNIEHILPAASLATDLLNEHIITGRYTIELQNGGSKTRQEITDIFLNRPDREANLLAPVEIQCDWLREIGFEQVDCYFRIFELAVFAGRRPNRKSRIVNRNS